MMSEITHTIGARAARGALVAALLVAADAAAAAEGAGAVVPLPEALAKAAEQYLPGVIGAPVPAFPIAPEMAALSAGSRTYAVVSGTTKTKSEQHQVAPGEKPGQWRYTIGPRTAFLHETRGESLAIVSEQDSNKGVLTRFSPPQPLLIAGMNAGDERSMTINVQVFDLDDPSDLEHKGSLDLTLRYVGAYKVTVPAGSFDAALLMWTYKGKIGPASIDDIQVRLVAPEVGMVAAAERLDVAALLVYSDNTKLGKVLQQK